MLVEEIKSWTFGVMLWFAIVFGYTFVGVLTYKWNDELYPEAAGARADEDGSPFAGLLWPIGLPVTAAIAAARTL